MNIKRVLSAILAVAMLLCAMPMYGVQAAGTPKFTVDAAMPSNDVDVSLEEQTIAVPIKVTDNPGFVTFEMDFTLAEGWSLSEEEDFIDYWWYYDDDNYSTLLAEDGKRGPDLKDYTYIYPNAEETRVLVATADNANGDGTVLYAWCVVSQSAVNGPNEFKIVAVENMKKFDENGKAVLIDDSVVGSGFINVIGGKDKLTANNTVVTVNNGEAVEYGATPTVTVTYLGETLPEANYDLKVEFDEEAAGEDKGTVTITPKDTDALTFEDKTPYVVTFDTKPGAATVSGIPTETVQMAFNDEKTLEIETTPEVALNYELSKSGIITITDGVMKAVGVGEVTVTVTGTSTALVDASAVTGTFNVNVVGAAQKDLAASASKTAYTYGDEGGTITVTGAPAGATIAYESSNENVVTVAENGKLTVVGKGNANITVTSNATGYNEATKVVAITVAPAQIKVSGVTAAGRTYAADDYTVTLNEGKTVTGIISGDDVTVTVAAQDLTVNNAGTQTANLTVTLEGSDAGNYELAADSQASVTVEIAHATIAVPTAASGLKYNGSEQTGVASANTEVYTVTGGTGTNAKADYAATATLIDSNYKWVDGTTEAKTITWSIAKADAQALTDSKTVRFSTTTAATYTAADIAKVLNAGEIVVTGATLEATNNVVEMSYAEVLVSYNLKSGLVAGDAGKYDEIVITFTSKNYEDSTLTLKVEVIDKTDVSDQITFEAGTAVYDGTVKTYENATCTLTGGTITYSYSPAEVKNVDTYTVTATYEDADNYGQKSTTFTITPKPVSITGMTAEKVYDGTTDATVTAVTFDDATLTEAASYTVDAGAAYASKNVGTPDVTFAVTLTDGNYQLTAASATLPGKITPKAITATAALAADSFTYDGTAKTPAVTLTATGLCGEDTLVLDTDYTVAYADNTAAGTTATVTVSAKSGSNYTVTVDPVTFTITKANPTVTVTSVTKEYDGTALNADDIVYTATFNDAAITGTWTMTGNDETIGKDNVSLKFVPANESLNAYETTFEGEITQNVLTSEEVTTTVEESISVKEYIDMLIANELTNAAGDVMIEEETIKVQIDGKDVTDLEKTKLPANAKVTVTAESVDEAKFADLNITVVPYKANVVTEIITNIILSSGSKAHGTVTWRPVAAEEGDTVTVTVRPDKGYAVKDVTVTASNGKDVKVHAIGSNKFTFVMPAGKAKIDVDYKKAETVKFNDVNTGDWYYDAVMYAVDNGLFNGVSDTEFAPNATMTRAMLVTVLWRMEGAPKARACEFKDVAEGAWYEEAVAWAAEESIVNGMTETSFAPNAAITREQMATILYRYAQYKGMSTRGNADLDDYTDADSISAYAAKAMNWAVANGLITGMTETALAPTGTATRAQVATILMRFLG